jgi:metal-responsive CopG/Arc/MetJ family transcriptional regulator
MAFVHLGARVPEDLAEQFDRARILDRRNRSEALRLAMEGYIAKVAGTIAVEGESRPHTRLARTAGREASRGK